MQIKEVAPHFGSELERIFFDESNSGAETRETITRLGEWILQNKFHRIGDFLEALSDVEVRAMYDYFKETRVVASSAELPIYVDEPVQGGQRVVLTLPFSGEWKVNGRKKNGDDTKSAELYFETPVSNTVPKVIAPAPCTAQSFDVKPDGATSTVHVMKLDLGNREEVYLGCVSESLDAKEFKRGEPVGRACRDGNRFYVDLSYMNKRHKDPVWELPMISAYFVRGEKEFGYRFVVLGTPNPGETVMDVQTYMSRSK